VTLPGDLPRALLQLATGGSWLLVAGNEGAARVVSALTQIMGLAAVDQPDLTPYRSEARTIAVYASNGSAVTGPREARGHHLPPHTWYHVTSDDAGNLTCVVSAPPTHPGLLRAMRSVSAALNRQVERRGGVLLHGGLIERAGEGVILAGQAGVGKTTASSRIPPPWRSLSDDATLVLPDDQGTYWAHPWPTWAKLIDPGVVLRWDVQQSVPLQAICFLAQAPTDSLRVLPPAQATCLLVQSAGQVPSSMWLLERPDQVRCQRLRLLDNIAALAGAVACHELQVSLTGAFWELIETAFG
jgi:SynChlorMet cassette protein ScmC